MARVTNPICRHKPTQRVFAGHPTDPERGYASTYVCSRDVCVEDALFWARAVAGEAEATVAPIGESRVAEAVQDALL